MVQTGHLVTGYRHLEMPPQAAASASAGDGGSTITNQLAMLVPRGSTMSRCGQERLSC